MAKKYCYLFTEGNAKMRELLGLHYQDAARTMRNIKRRTDRLGIRGKLHVQDYLDYFQIPPDRYVKPMEE